MTAAAAMGVMADLREEGRRCRAMWCAVLARVVMDARRRDADGDAARHWLRDPDAMLLVLLDLDAATAGPSLARLAGPGELHGLSTDG